MIVLEGAHYFGDGVLLQDKHIIAIVHLCHYTHRYWIGGRVVTGQERQYITYIVGKGTRICIHKGTQTLNGTNLDAQVFGHLLGLIVRMLQDITILLHDGGVSFVHKVCNQATMESFVFEVPRNKTRQYVATPSTNFRQLVVDETRQRRMAIAGVSDHNVQP